MLVDAVTNAMDDSLQTGNAAIDVLSTNGNGVETAKSSQPDNVSVASVLKNVDEVTSFANTSKSKITIKKATPKKTKNSNTTNNTNAISSSTAASNDVATPIEPAHSYNTRRGRKSDASTPKSKKLVTNEIDAMEVEEAKEKTIKKEKGSKAASGEPTEKKRKRGMLFFF
jgi:hypothetical protein